MTHPKRPRGPNQLAKLIIDMRRGKPKRNGSLLSKGNSGAKGGARRAAGDAKAGTYSADDLMIVERDIGRLAKYTFDMGGAGDLLSLSLNVPPWEDLHELSRDELRLTNLVTTDAVAEGLPKMDVG